MFAALALFLLGLYLYFFIISGFDREQLGNGSGDQRVAGGALAIGALAAARVAIAAQATQTISALIGPLHIVAMTVWVLSMTWLGVAARRGAPTPAARVRPRPVVDVLSSWHVRRLHLRRCKGRRC